MPVAEWVTGPQYPAEVKWAYKLEHCPTMDELGRCVGKFVIYAYLQVTEERSTLFSWLPGVDPDYYEWKILPMKFEEEFKINCVNVFGQAIGGNAHAAEHCSKGCDTPAPSPKKVGESQFEYAVPACVVDPDPPKTDGPVMKSTTTLTWQQGIVLASLPPGTGGTLDIPGLGPVTLGASGGQVTSGPAHSVKVDWTITWDGGICTVDISPDPSTTYDDAKRIYDVRESVREL